MCIERVQSAEGKSTADCSDACVWSFLSTVWILPTKQKVNVS